MGVRRMLVGVVAAAVGVLGVLPAAASAAEIDTTPPVLHGVSFSTAAVTAPSTVTLTLDATDDVGIFRSEARFFEEGSHRPDSSTDQISPLTLDLSLSAGDANGTWRIYDIRLTDEAGNQATYVYDGRYFSRPSSTTRTHDLDLSSPSVVLTGASDRTPPTLESVRRVSTTGRAGEPSTWSWAVSDAENLPATISAVLANPATGHEVSTGDLPASPGSGTWSLTVPHAGVWRLDRVYVADAVGNRAIYRLGGQVQIGYALFPGSHAVPFETLGLGTAPNTFTARVVERPGRLALVLPDSISPANLTGVRVTASPSGVVVEQPLGAGAPLTVDLTDLPNGVRQTLSVTLTSTWGDSPVMTFTGRPVLSRNVTGTLDVTGDRRPDLFAVRQAGVGQDPMVIAYPGTGTGGVRNGAAFIPADRSPRCDSIAAVDVVTSAGAELLCRAETLTAVRGDASAIVLGSKGWGTMRWVDGGFDLNGDGRSDVLAMNSEGDLALYRQTTQGKLLAPVLVSRGWQSMLSVVSAGDLTGDRRNDVVAVDASGRLWLYPGTGTGTLGARRQLATGWHTMGALLPMRDFNGDGKSDLGGITMDGRLLVYRGTGAGAVRAGVVIAQGWQVFL